MPCLEITEVVLIHWNVAHNSYQQSPKLLYTFVSNKSFGQFLNISPQNFTFLKTFDSEFLHNHIWFTDQPYKQLEIEDKINSILVINQSIKMTPYSAEARDRLFVEGYGFLSFAKTMGKCIGKNISKSLNSKCSQKPLDMLKNLQQMCLKLLQKESFKKQQKQTVI